MSQAVTMGILGLGRMGLVHAQQIAGTPGLRLVAVSGRAAELLEEARRRFGVRAYGRHEALLADPEVRWVVIATTTDRHTEWALKALAAGKELIIEKPVALSLEETRQIFAVARAAGLRVTVHQNRRWDADFQLVRRVLAEGTLGELYRLESRYTHFSAGWGTWGAQGQANPWRLKKSFGGGLLNDWGPHLFDQLVLLHPGSAGTLFGRCESRIWSQEVEDHFWAELLFANGLSARVEAANTFRIPVPRWTAVGTRGTLQVSGGDPDQWNSAVVRRGSADSIQEWRYDISHPELSTGFYGEFVRALAAGHALPVLPEQALRVMRLIEAVRESSQLGRSVVVEESAAAEG